MKREVTKPITAECGRHRLTLTGVPFFDRDNEDKHRWHVDLSDMECPQYALDYVAAFDAREDPDFIDALTCEGTWRVWLDA